MRGPGGFLVLGVERVRLLLREGEVALVARAWGCRKNNGGWGPNKIRKNFWKMLVKLFF